ncbi:MAG: DEAD/DEAH box helicase, partial [Ramlibacter sp.]|nr:DEAD/DEAH box helicase [Ramlibacter sp.]
MTDTFEVQGDFAPAEILDTVAFDSGTVQAVEAVEVAAEPVPNGFIKLGLAPELMLAIAELGFTQPTTVQEQTIPLALPSDDEAAAYIDLMVSSQTGSGKTAAFLLPVLHTLLKQQADAEAKSRAEFERLTA